MEGIPKQASLVIKVDVREEADSLCDLLSRQYGVRVQREYLRIGDYVINDAMVIERKTSADFARSLIDGRLFRQAFPMQRAFPHSAFIIEGTDLYQLPIKVHANAIRGALVNLMLGWNIPVFLAADHHETALWLSLTGKQRLPASQRHLSWRPGRQPKRQTWKRQLYVLQGLPHIGPILAARLLESFGTVEQIIVASDEQLQRIPRIGVRKAQAIRQLVTTLHRTASQG